VGDWAVIFDVDGVLLDLTHDEEEVFFTALSHFVPTDNLSRDWNSYRVRNDEDIITEILERNGLHSRLKVDVATQYIALLAKALQDSLKSVVLPGAADMLTALSTKATLGIATANLKMAAELRLRQAGLWSHVSAHSEGADGGGHKSVVLARLLKRMMIPRSRTIYVGDNVNDVEAGLQNGVHFVGFSVFAKRRLHLQSHGALRTSRNHAETLEIIQSLMA
jgi:phosphoglycolate phosphatase-like HAD superfamily hydrolase